MKAVIFDFDGVIADTYDYGKSIVEKIGHDVSDDVFKAHHDGNVYEEPKISFTEESSEEYFKKYYENVHETKPFISLNQIKLFDKNYDLFIISSNIEKGIEKFLLHNKMNYFKEVLGKDFHKSKIEKFKYLFKKYDLKKEDCIFITDTLWDIFEWHKVWVETIAVDFWFHERERLKKWNPFKIVSNFDEILEMKEV